MRGAGVGALILALFVPTYAAADGRCAPHSQRGDVNDTTWSRTGYTEHSGYTPWGRTHHYAHINLEWTCEYRYDCTAHITINDTSIGAGEHGTNDWHPLYQHIIGGGHAGPGEGGCTGFKCEAETSFALGYAVASCAFGNCSLNLSASIGSAGGVFGGGFEFAAGGAIPWGSGSPVTGIGYGTQWKCGAAGHQVITPPGGGGGCFAGPGTTSGDCEEPTCDSWARSDCISNCGDWDESTCTCYMPPGGCGCIPEERDICEQENGDFDEATCTCRY